MERFNSKIKPKELQVFMQRLASLAESGVPIVESLESMQGEKNSQRFDEVLNGIIAQIKSGRPLATSMSLFPDVFNQNHISLVTIGEEAGNLPVILSRLAKYIEKYERLRSRFSQMMWYPLLIIFVCVALGISFITFITPTFIKILSIQAGGLPPLTAFIFYCSEMLRTHWYMIFGILIIPIGIGKYYKSKEGRKVIDQILIRTPIIGPFIIKGALASFSQTLAILLASGLKIMESIEMAAPTVRNVTLEADLLRSRWAIEKGKTVAKAMEFCECIPEMVINMVHVGEQSGHLDYMFEKIAEFYEEEVDNTVSSFVTLIEPVLMIGIGGFVALIVVALYLPLFNLAGSVEHLF